MGRRRTRLLAMVFVGGLPWAAGAQAVTPPPTPPQTPPPAPPPATPPAPPQGPTATPTPPPPTQAPTTPTLTLAPPTGQVVNVSTVSQAPPTILMGGIPAADYLLLHSIGPGAPLRHGNVIPGSERVLLDGYELVSGRDYMMDYATGVVYLELAQTEGESLVVTYRYSPLPGNAPPALGSLGAFKVSLMPGSLNLLVGVGLADRNPDGSVYDSNVVGFNNNFHFGQTTVNGAMMFGSRTRSDAEEAFDLGSSNRFGQSVTDGGGSTFVVEDIATKTMGGTAQIDYQQISRGFGGLGALRSGGYDAAAVTRFQHEEGLTRAGESLTDLKFGSLTLTESYRTVQEGSSHIDWGYLGLAGGGFKFNWSTQVVDAHFDRFKDLAESDHDQIAKAIGVSRQDWSGQFVDKVAKLGFNATSIEDTVSGGKIDRDEVTLDTSRIKFDLGQQEVAPNFARFSGLMASETALYGHDAGLYRQWMSVQAAILGPNMPFAYSQSLVGSSGGDLTARDASLSGRGWALLHSERGLDAGFTGLSQLQPAELDLDTKAIARMYGPGVVSTPGDRAGFLAGLGIHRIYTGAAIQITNDWAFNFNQLNLKGQLDKGDLTTATLASKNATFSYRHEDVGPQFAEITTMMGFEQKQLGSLAGLDRTDMSASFLSGVKKLDLTHMEAGSPTGEASHDGLAYHDKGIDLTANQRTVDPGFTSVAQLAGPDAGLMSTMIGYKESDANLKWQILPHLNLDASIQDTINRETNQASRLHQMTANWSPDATTKIEFFGLDQSNHDPLSTVFASNIDRLTMSKSLGRYGVLTFSDESQQFDQSVLAAQGITGLTSYNTQYFSYEAKLTPKTSFKTEEALTEFSNGERQSVNAETISTAITPRLGVSVSDVNIDHKGGDQAPDSMVAHRNAGFYYDLGHGLIFNYGYARQLAPNDGGTTTTEMTLGGLPPNTTLGAMPTPDKIGTVPPGMIGDFTVTGGYAANQWDSSNRTQAFSNLAITAVKPFQLGPLSNVKFGAAMDSATDYSNWIKEDRNFLFTGNLGPNALGLMYKSQLAQPNVQAIDRGFMLVSDPSNLRWFNAAISYKARTLPNDQDMLIRSYALSARIVKGLQISNQFQTEPEIAQPAALLGSVAQATRSDKWKLEYATTPNLTLGGSWEEMRNDASGTMARTAGLNAKLWDQSGSPVTIFYGMEQADNPTLTRTTARYSIQYDQRPGPNQMLSVFLGNISYVGSVPQGFQTDNWTVRINYQLRF